MSPSTWRQLARTSDAVALGSFGEEEDAARGVMGRGDRPICLCDAPLASPAMEDLPRRLAELLEMVATRIRSMTIDRVARVITTMSLTLPLAVFALLAAIFLFLTIHRALAIPLTTAGAHGVIAGLFAIGGALIWRKRTPSSED